MLKKQPEGEKKTTHAQNVVKIVILPKTIYRLNIIPIKIIAWFFIKRNTKIYFIIHMTEKQSWIVKEVLSVSSSMILSYTTKL